MMQIITVIFETEKAKRVEVSSFKVFFLQCKHSKHKFYPFPAPFIPATYLTSNWRSGIVDLRTYLSVKSIIISELR